MGVQTRRGWRTNRRRRKRCPRSLAGYTHMEKALMGGHCLPNRAILWASGSKSVRKSQPVSQSVGKSQ